MKKRILLLLPVVVLACLALACRGRRGNGASGQLPEANLRYPIEIPDTLFGFKGCDRPGFRAQSPKAKEFIYQDFIVRVTQRDDNAAGEKLEVVFNAPSKSIEIPDAEPTYFAGGAFGHIFVDVGTAPDVRDIIVYNLKENSLAQVYRERYCVEGETFVSQNGGFWFYCPVPESEVSKKPACPEKESWTQKGLQTAYGQRCIYGLVNRGLTRKSEFICVAMQ